MLRLTRTSGETGSRIGRLAILIVVVLFAACADESSTPREARIRALIDNFEDLAEKGEVRALSDLISEEYADARGNKKASLQLLLTHYIGRHRSIHLLTRTARVDLQDSTHADVLVFVAMAGRPISSVRDLGAVRADLYHFNVAVAEEDGEWRVVGARWERGWDADVPDVARPTQ